MNLAVRERQPMAICVEEPALIRAITIEPNVTRHDQDAHIRAWHAYLFDMANPCKAHIRMRCADLGVFFEDVIGSCRDKEIYKIRDMIVFDIKTDVKPGISYPERGRLFGKDHTSAILSYHRHAARLGDPESAARIERKRAESRRGHDARRANAA